MAHSSQTTLCNIYVVQQKVPAYIKYLEIKKQCENTFSTGVDAHRRSSSKFKFYKLFTFIPQFIHGIIMAMVATHQFRTMEKLEPYLVHYTSTLYTIANEYGTAALDDIESPHLKQTELSIMDRLMAQGLIFYNDNACTTG